MRGLARSRPVLRHASLTACMTLALRPLVASQFSAKDISAYLINVLSVPGLVSHLQSTAPEVRARAVVHRGTVGPSEVIQRRTVRPSAVFQWLYVCRVAVAKL